MNIYKISQDVNNGYDTYDAAIVAAESEEKARAMHPGGSFYDKKCWEDERFPTWAYSQEQVKVELIGVAKEGTPAGVVLASFNAG